MIECLRSKEKLLEGGKDMTKVIIADDEEKVCQLICSLVDWDSLDMEIAGIAHNGIEALDLVERVKPALLITDIRMPGYNGLELISRVKQVDKNIDFIIISGYSHFEYAKSAIKYGVVDYLLKPIKKNELMDILLKMKKKYKERIEQQSKEEYLRISLQSGIDKLRSSLFPEILLQKNNSSVEELTIDKINGDYHYQFQKGLFQVAIMKIDCGLRERYNNIIRLFEDKIGQVLTHNLKKSCFDMEIYFEDSMTYIALNYEKNSKKTIRKQLKAAFDELFIQKNIFGQLELTIGVGSAVADIQGLADSCKTAQTAIAERLIIGTGNMIEKVESSDTEKSTNKILAKLNKMMDGALEVLDKKGVLSSIEFLQKSIESEPHINGEEAFRLCKEVCNMYLTFLRNYQLAFQHAEEFYEEFCEYANRCGSIKEILQYLTKIIGKSMDQIIEDRKQADTKPIRLAKQYIQHNYMNPISLDEVSSYVGFSASYFSTLFKKESGRNFLEYLSEVRMNQAKELLKETNLSIAVICEQVGYSDLKHFTKSFKKITGIKPNEYRKLYS